MSKKTAVLWGSLIMITGLLVYGSWYKNRYSMDKVESYEVNDSSLSSRLLIATQGSEYKNQIVSQIVGFYRHRPIHIKVIDISDLPQIDNTEWNVILIIHTWEMWKPPSVVSTYLERNGESGHIIALTTSGNGNYKMQGLDAITGASKMDEIPAKVETLKKKLNRILNQ